MSNFILVHGKCTNVSYSQYGIQLTVFSEDSNPSDSNCYPKQLITYDTELANYLSNFTNLDFEEIPAFDFPVIVFAKAYTKDGQIKAFPTFTIEKSFDITTQIS